LNKSSDYWQKTVGKTVEKWRFAEVDFSSAYNDFGGRYNAPNHSNEGAFATLKADGSGFKGGKGRLI
jgi:hypothetical protein